MKLFLLLDAVSDGAQKTVWWISVAAVAVCAIILVTICFTKKSLNTRAIVYAGICVALSTVLSLLKFGLSFGGSITLASLCPVLIYSYVFGFKRGLATGAVYGILQFIVEPYILTPLTFVLDYIIPFSAIAVASTFKKFKNTALNAVFGCILYFAVRFISHVFSGLIYFGYGYVYETFPQSSALIYSICYNAAYVLPDAAICLVVFTLVYLNTRKFSLLIRS